MRFRTLVLVSLCSAVSAQTVTTSTQEDLAAKELQSLMDVKVITASKFPEKMADAPGIVTVVRQDELRRFGAITLREVLERVAGLMGGSTYFTDRSVIAVGGDQARIDGGHILFLINGRPTREILQGGIISDLLESFPITVLERIEVIRGPGSVLYGSNAFSGVVNLITKKAEGTTLAITAMGAGAGGRAGSGLLTFERGSLNIVGGAQFHQRPDWSTAYYARDQASGVVSKETIHIQDHGPGAYLGVNYKGLRMMGSFTEWKDSTFVVGVVGENLWRRGFANLGYDLKVRPWWEMSFDLTYTRNKLHSAAFAEIDRDSHEVLAEWTNSVKLSRRDRVTFGTLFNHQSGREMVWVLHPNLVISKGSRPGGAIYAQLDHQLLDTVKVIGGFQANKIGDLAWKIVPRAGVIWSPTLHVAVKALYSEAFRAPSINENFLNHPGLRGDRALDPETVGTVDLSVSYQGNRIYGSASYYHSTQADIIVVPAPDPVTGLRTYTNLGEARFQGGVVEGKYYFKKNFFFAGSALYQANHDDLGNHNITPIANWGAKAGLSYEAANGFSASAFDNYQGPAGYGAGGLNPAPRAYHLPSARVRFDLARHLPVNSKAGWALFAYGDNLTNRQVWMPEWGGNPGDSIPVFRGRTVYFGLEMTLRGE